MEGILKILCESEIDGRESLKDFLDTWKLYSNFLLLYFIFSQSFSGYPIFSVLCCAIRKVENISLSHVKRKSGNKIDN